LAEMPDGRQRGLSRRAPSDHSASQLPLRTRSITSTVSADTVDPRARGTLIHAWFDQICWLDRDSRPSPEQLRLVANDPFIRDLRLSEKAFESLMKEFLSMIGLMATQTSLTQSAALERFAHQSAIADISGVNLRVESERPFVYREQGHIVRGTIDRLVIAEQSGKNLAAEVIDFKTDRLFGDRNVWIAQKQNDYADQLQDYRTAVSRCFGIPSDCITTSLLLLEADACMEVL
jgi:ATP-dependent exoDNAse (exonuclease V) beta subunit